MGKAKAKLTPAEKAQRRSHTIKHLKQYSALYAMMILPLLYASFAASQVPKKPRSKPKSAPGRIVKTAQKS